MLEKEYKKVTHVVTEEAVIAANRCCDNCEKEITSGYYDVEIYEARNCSDTLDEYDACSVKCLMELFDKYIERCSKNPFRDNEEMVFYVHHHIDANLGKIVSPDKIIEEVAKTQE